MTRHHLDFDDDDIADGRQLLLQDDEHEEQQRLRAERQAAAGTQGGPGDDAPSDLPAPESGRLQEADRATELSQSSGSFVASGRQALEEDLERGLD